MSGETQEIHQSDELEVESMRPASLPSCRLPASRDRRDGSGPPGSAEPGLTRAMVALGRKRWLLKRLSQKAWVTFYCPLSKDPVPQPPRGLECWIRLARLAPKAHAVGKRPSQADFPPRGLAGRGESQALEGRQAAFPFPSAALPSVVRCWRASAQGSPDHGIPTWMCRNMVTRRRRTDRGNRATDVSFRGEHLRRS
ncbi:hypothetical protein AAFF_G00291760 [Aldrovandia affinis]|uniref:Uncharacterized protein n=1 Tax=Aldrovandia affinis TaxID=143900 RepID=A0AAD7SQT2_9TELE|nr:hypothetical protein AAFF_G00291760 [Aldrovandia affinis]